MKLGFTKEAAERAFKRLRGEDPNEYEEEAPDGEPSSAPDAVMQDSPRTRERWEKTRAEYENAHRALENDS